MVRGRGRELGRRIAELISDFDRFVTVGSTRSPFGRAGQWDLHIETIRRRRQLGSVEAALADDGFLDSAESQPDPGRDAGGRALLMAWYLDTSAAVKLMVAEVGSTGLRRWLAGRDGQV